MPNRAQDWIVQAKRDLEQAVDSKREKRHEWACFAAQQAAEKALKAVYEKINQSARGHSILGLMRGLEDRRQIPEGFYSYARILSRYYIETRYPNGFPEGAPADYFDEALAKEAIHAGEEIVRWCGDFIAGYK